VVKKTRSKHLEAPFDNVKSILSFGDFRHVHTGVHTPLEADVLIADMRRYGWRPTFFKLASLAALLANHGIAAARTMTSDVLISLNNSDRRAEREIGEYVTANPGRSDIANEAAIYFLEAMAILYGNDTEDMPSDGLIAYWLLVANDFAFDWRGPNSRALSDDEAALPNAMRAMTFNHRRDPVRHFVRMYLMFANTPPRTPGWSEPNAWMSFLTDALGLPLSEYVETHAGPLVILSKLWCAKGPFEPPPTVHPHQWLSETTLDPKRVDGFLESLALSRDDARAQLVSGLASSGLPIGPTLFYRFPFVRFSNTSLVAASPWVVAEQLRGGLWGRAMSLAKRQDPASGHMRWASAFGDLFELYCRHCVNIARTSTRFRERVLMSETIGGDDEIEDIVIRDERRLALMSIKSNTIPESKLRQASSESDVVDWVEKWLFGRAQKQERLKTREGAIRQLDQKVRRLREGAYEPTLDRRAQVYPVIVMYDELGVDNVAVYKWVAARCRNEDLLQDSRTRPLTFVHINEFEELVALGSNGVAVLDVLQRKTRAEWAAQMSFSVHLREVHKNYRHRRLSGLLHEYNALTSRMKARLFRDPGARDRNSRELG
jgi:hypothetical protein